MRLVCQGYPPVYLEPGQAREPPSLLEESAHPAHITPVQGQGTQPCLFGVALVRLTPQPAGLALAQGPWEEGLPGCGGKPAGAWCISQAIYGCQGGPP